MGKARIYPPNFRRARVRARITSVRALPKRAEHSSTVYPSKTDKMRANRSNGPNRAIASRRSLRYSLIADCGESASETGSSGIAAGETIRMALVTIILRLQRSAHSLRTGRPEMQSSRPAPKHCSALWWSAVNRNASRYRWFISSVNIWQKVRWVAYSFLLAVASEAFSTAEIFINMGSFGVSTRGCCTSRTLGTITCTCI